MIQLEKQKFQPSSSLSTHEDFENQEVIENTHKGS